MLNDTIEPHDAFADCQHVLGGVWGHHVGVLDEDDLHLTAERQPSDMVNICIHGHLPFHNRIEAGHYVTVEFGSCFVTFITHSIEWMSDPRDQFFAKMDAVRVCSKSTGDLMWKREKPTRTSGFWSELWSKFFQSAPATS